VRHPEESCLALALTRQIGRNWGGRFGNALITTVAERRQKCHQTSVGGAVTATYQQSRRARMLWRITWRDRPVHSFASG
jgi:hypothetical protein